MHLWPTGSDTTTRKCKINHLKDNITGRCSSSLLAKVTRDYIWTCTASSALFEQKDKKGPLNSLEYLDNLKSCEKPTNQTKPKPFWKNNGLKISKWNTSLVLCRGQGLAQGTQSSFQGDIQLFSCRFFFSLSWHKNCRCYQLSVHILHFLAWNQADPHHAFTYTFPLTAALHSYPCTSIKYVEKYH